VSTITQMKDALRVLATSGLNDVAEIRVVPGPAEYTERQDFDKIGFNIIVITGPVGDDEAEQHLDWLLDPQVGMRAALEVNRDLDGLVSDLVVRKSSGYQMFPGPPITTSDRHGSTVAPGRERVGATWHVICMI